MNIWQVTPKDNIEKALLICIDIVIAGVIANAIITMIAAFYWLPINDEIAKNNFAKWFAYTVIALVFVPTRKFMRFYTIDFLRRYEK